MLCPTFTILLLLCLAYCHPSSSMESIQQKHIDRLFAEATEKGYAIEQQGVVAKNLLECGTIIFDFEDWLSGRNFWEAGQKLEINQNYNETVDLIIAVGNDLIRELGQTFVDKTAHLKKSVGPSIEVLEPVDTIKINKVSKKNESNPSYEDNIEKEIMAKERKEMMRKLADHHKSDFESILDSFKDRYITNLVIDKMGGEAIYNGIISKILGHKYNGSLAQELKENLARAISFEVAMLVQPGSIAVKICVPDMYRDTMLPLFEIRPIGSIEGDIYSEYEMPNHYALYRSFETMADLSIVDSFIYQQNGFSIVSGFNKQDSKVCNLESPFECQRRTYNLTAHGGTMVFSMKRLSIVATNQEYGNCTNEIGMMKLESHVFVHDHGKCTLKVGPEVVGDRVFGVKLVPRKYPVYAFNDVLPEHHSHSDMSLGLQITIGVGISSVVIVVAGLLVLYYCYPKCRRKTETERSIEATERAVKKFADQMEQRRMGQQ